MITDLTIEERLNQQLNEANKELAVLRERLRSFEHHRPWTDHIDRPEDPHRLPVPRLEMSLHEGDFGCGYRWEARYCLVYRHLRKHIVWVPMGSTRIGGTAHPDANYLPWRDGHHIWHDSLQLNLPAFSVSLNGERRRLINPEESAPLEET